MRWLFVAIVLVTAASPARAQRVGFDPKQVYKIPLGSAPIEGPADAPITIVVWSDYACGYCSRVQATLVRLEQLYPGQLRWVHRTLPIDDDYTLHAETALAAAAQGKFRPMHARLFALRGRVTRAEAELAARELGLDMIRFRSELDTGAHRAALAADLADARTLGVTGTPTFFVNGRPVHGNQPLRVFADVVDEELARAERVREGRPVDLYQALVGSGQPTADSTQTEHDEFELDPGAAYLVGLGLPGHQQGPDDALVTIVVWNDFQCPYCAKQVTSLEHVRAKLGDQVRVVFRHLPMAGHKKAMLAAEAAVEAATQGKFWAYQDQVWKHFGQLARADLDAFAQVAGLDLGRFRAALDERRHHGAVLAEAAAGLALGIDGTPTLFINGQPIIGSRAPDKLLQIVEGHLGLARAAVARGLAPRDLYSIVMATAEGAERADPATIPQNSLARVELRADDKARSAIAACRRRDGQRARSLAGGLPEDVRRRVTSVCRGEGVDLP
jgi:protein-disulfide isomerase